LIGKKKQIDSEDLQEAHGRRLPAPVRHQIQTALSGARIRQIHMQDIVIGQEHHEPIDQVEKGPLDHHKRARVQRRGAICRSMLELCHTANHLHEVQSHARFGLVQRLAFMLAQEQQQSGGQTQTDRLVLSQLQ
jgi:hypothetical protein